MSTLARAPALARFGYAVSGPTRARILLALAGARPARGTPGMTDLQLGPDPVRRAVLSRRIRPAHPLVEELKEESGDRITFVNRYFPSPDTGTRVPLPWRWRLPRSKAITSRWQRSCSKPRPSGAESRTDRHPCSGATRRNWD